jgi:hypothetical protein
VTLPPRGALLAIALLCVAMASAACAAPAQPAATGTPAVTPVTSGTVVPTSTAVVVPAISSGAITTPARDSAARTAILQAVTEGLSLNGVITVYQLFSQGTAAVGDILSGDGKRMFFAVTGGPETWVLAWSAPFGSALADVGALESAAPLVSPALAAKLIWDKKIPKPTPAAPTLASFEVFAMKSAKTFAGSTYAGTFTLTAKIAKDSTGAWWGNAIAVPSVDGLESIGVWGHYSGGKWTGEIADFSTEDAETGFFPADVIPRLALP